MPRVSLAWERSLLVGGHRVLVAVSGGADSLALLHLLSHAREDHGCEVVAVHVHHGMRGASAEADVGFLEETCREWNVPLEVVRADVPRLAREHRISVEEAGRDARYKAFGDVAARRGCERVATAHTADDQAETVLMRLFRGAGLDGLAGIPRRRPLRAGEPSPEVVRPLLNVWRRDIEAYCQAHKLEPRLDVTNLDRRYRRSRIRLELIPKLEEYDPHLKRHLVRLAAQAASEKELLHAQAQALYGRSAIRSTALGYELGLSVAELGTAPPALVRRVIRLAFRELRLPDMDREAEFVERVSERVSGERRAPLDLPGKRLRVVREKDAIWFVLADRRTLLPPSEVEVSVGETWLPEWGFKFKVAATKRPTDARQPPDRVYVDEQTVNGSLVLRPPRRGDRFTPLGSPGSRLLSDVFTDKKVPRAERERWPVIVDETGIVWVVGLAVADRCRVTEMTRGCLLLQTEVASDPVFQKRVC